ncbi:MAG: glutamine--fructose-6-phosphate transaminase (isomerizing) [Rhodocyclaceae bacterium]|nr:glutamine--fructose-6-phosphate transaminase (isomerizing) [Rhodocyclaceae bacterium]
MCGIVSAVSSGRDVVPFLIEGLKRLEYRGYDSAGIAVINGRLHRIRSVGRVAELASCVAQGQLAGGIGIGHTRWATHGVPSERNAHPHVSGGVSVVHNGIIENHEEMRAALRRQGYEFSSETDTEVIAHLIHAKLRGGATLFDAVRLATAELVGAYAIAVISDADASRLVVARNGAPLLLGLGDGENYAASDGAALAAATRQLIHLEDGDCAEITRSAIRIVDGRGNAVQRPVVPSLLTAASVELGGYRHYMQKEIFEQPTAVANTLELAINGSAVAPQIFGADAEEALRASEAVLILACGTSYHAAMVARYWLEGVAGIPCSVEIASEYRYREPVASPATLVVSISQSGETADTLAAQRYAMTRGHRVSLCICNVPESSLLRASDLRFLTRAGPEIGVASTKAFTTQLVALALLTLVLAKLQRRLPAEREREILHDLKYLPAAMCRMLDLEPHIAHWADVLAAREHALFLGRGVHYPIAMEGALKLKEISYIHAEAHAAGELKHGPLALVSRDMPVIAIAPRDALIGKIKANLNEVSARGGELYVLADRDARIEDSAGIHVIRTPEYAGFLSPILYAIPLQLLAYHAAVARRNDVDKPRNLAKSVTVE